MYCRLPQAQVIQGPEVEQFLKKARFVAREPLGSGVTGSLKVTLELDGKSQFAVLKTVDQKRPGAQLNAKGEIEIDFQDSWRTEVAAYELDKLLGLGMVPATIERTSPYENKPASLQLWVEASMSEAKRREKSHYSAQRGQMVRSADRHEHFRCADLQHRSSSRTICSSPTPLMFALSIIRGLFVRMRSFETRTT